MRIKSQKDFYSGVLFLLAALGFGWGATDYRIGTSAHMGPGYFPLLCSALLGLIGAVICIRALTMPAPDGGRIGRWAWRPLCLVVLANMAFGILLAGWPTLRIPALGFGIASLVLIVIAAAAGAPFRWRESLVLAAVLAAGSWLIFVKGLDMQFPTWLALAAPAAMA